MQVWTSESEKSVVEGLVTEEVLGALMLHERVIGWQSDAL